MSQIDATGLVIDFDAFDQNNINHQTFVDATPASYEWQATNGYYITALSFQGDITYPPASLGGTVNAINIVYGTYDPVLNITGLDLPLTSILDTGSAAAMQEKFWEAVLAGDTTILTPTTSGHTLKLMGDFVTVNTGDDVTGGNDTFTGDNVQGNGTLTGDAGQVDPGATLHGGNDIFNGAVSDHIIGDVGNGANYTFGTVYGGNDTVAITDPNYNPTLALEDIIGDVEFPGGVVNGGNDRITLLNVSFIRNVIGDNRYMAGNDTGGNDTIRFETTIAGRQFASFTTVSGDDLDVHGSVGNLTATGGDDSIILNNVEGTYVVGDFNTFTGATGFGGNDTISVAGTFPLTTPPPPYPITPTVHYIDGDAFSVDGTHPFTGGNDSIRLSNINDGFTAGDVHVVKSLPKFTGGNDTITFSYDRANTGGLFDGVGNSFSVSSAVFNGGNNSITASLVKSLLPTASSISGDIYDYSALADGAFHGGNDTLIANTAAMQNAYLYGDAISLYAGSNLAAHGGNDALTGGAGDDSLYGDWETASAEILITAEVGGNDTLDGRGGNDFIDGGGGTDTAKFSLHQSVYVDLNGIPGTAASSTDFIEAIGQGNDQLVSIENVIGSALGDVILGDAGQNVLTGQGGTDRLMGRGGNDTLVGGASGDVLGGGAGTDRAQYLDAAAGLTADLQVAANNTGIAAGDSYFSIENLYGSNFDDILRGNGLANAIWGVNGNDVIVGRNGDDSLYGMDGNDTLLGGAGADLLNGGAGTDRAQYNDATAGLTVDLQVSANNTGFAGGDSYVSIEDLYGSNFGDTLRGDAVSNSIRGADGNDIILGRDGNDSLYGMNGNDTLIGQAGRDFLYGGAGNDTFVYQDTVDSAPNFLRDQIYGFAKGADLINLLNIDAKTTVAGNQAFSFIGAAGFHGVAGELHSINSSGDSLVEGDVNGDGSADFAVLVAGVHDLGAGNFLL